MHDATNLLGNFKILHQKFIKKSQKVDDFNTRNSINVFNHLIQKDFNLENTKFKNFNLADVYSLLYWRQTKAIS